MRTLGTGVVHILWHMPPCCSPLSSAAPTLGHAPSFLTWTWAGASWQTSCCPPCPYNLSPHSSPSDLVKSEIGSMPPPCLCHPPTPWSSSHLQSRSVFLPGLQSPVVPGPGCLLKANPCSLPWPLSPRWTSQAHSHLQAFTLAVALIIPRQFLPVSAQMSAPQRGFFSNLQRLWGL